MAQETRSRDIGIWIGSEFYPKRQDYIDEALELGCSRKVPRIPEGIVLGQSRAWLFHKELKERGTRKRKAKDHQAVIFGYFVIDGLIA